MRCSRNVHYVFLREATENMYYVYILQSLKDDSYYTGFTTDVESRLKTHNSGSVVYTSTKLPFKLVWYCCFKDKLKAIGSHRII